MMENTMDAVFCSALLLAATIAANAAMLTQVFA